MSFIAKFSQTTGNPFKSDKNGQMPFIGTVLAGTANGTLINGTMFSREGLEANTLYLCENSVDEAYPTNTRVDIICKVSALEFMDMRAKLGAGKTVLTSQVSVEDTEPVLAQSAGKVK